MTGLDFECAKQKKQEVNLLKVALKKKNSSSYMLCRPKQESKARKANTCVCFPMIHS
jgi:hypothetical protein